MPARTNARQRVIVMLQAQRASPGVTVTESKALWDPVLERHREVDVVVEDVVGGVPIVVGIEVVDWSRPAGVPWVEQMIAKHERLGTNALVLVSWSGFAGSVAKKVASYGGKVTICMPAADDGRASPRELYVDEVTVRPKRAIVEVQLPDGTLGAGAAPSDLPLLDSDGNSVSTLGDFVGEVLRGAQFGMELGRIAHHDPERSTRTYFSCRTVPREPLYVSVANPDRLVKVSTVEIHGPFRFTQAPLTLQRLVALGSTFEAGHFDMSGRTGVVVRAGLADDTENPTTTISFL